MIRIEIEKATGKVTHIDATGKRTVIVGLPINASLKAIEARLKALSLAVE